MTLSASIEAYFPLGPVSGDFPFAENGRRIILTRDFAYVDSVDGLPVTTIVPAGFVSDFNSTPRFIWTYFPPWECPEAGVAHDWLYRYPGSFSRGDIDRLHRRIMELKNERKAKRALAWVGIRAGGWKPWNEYRRNEHA